MIESIEEIERQLTARRSALRHHVGELGRCVKTTMSVRGQFKHHPYLALTVAVTSGLLLLRGLRAGTLHLPPNSENDRSKR